VYREAADVILDGGASPQETAVILSEWIMDDGGPDNEVAG
jgi:hypothetical protein